MAHIRDIIARRTDLSTFLLHFTRDQAEPATTALQQLEAILRSGALEARSPMGTAVKRLEQAGRADWLPTQRVVCFTETPLEHANLLLQDIEGRACSFRPYAIALPKKQGRRLGINPVWYVDITPAPGRDWLTNHLNYSRCRSLSASPAASSPCRAKARGS